MTPSERRIVLVARIAGALSAGERAHPTCSLSSTHEIVMKALDIAIEAERVAGDVDMVHAARWRAEARAADAEAGR